MKLKGRSLAEFRERARQGANIVAERFGLSSRAKLPPDADLFRRFSFSEESSSAANLFEHFRTRKTAKFYTSFDDLKATIAVLRYRFPVDEAAIIKRAERICDGYFDLLGYENLRFENKIPNWHFDPVSQKTSPRIHWSRVQEVNSKLTGDKKIIWELNRHQYFTNLGQAYWLTKNEKYAETFIAHLESWFESNPPKIGVNWLSSLEIAFRSISWIRAFHFFKESPRFTADIFVRILKYLYLNGRHIETYLSTYFSPNTHLTGEALGLYFLATFLPELEDAKRWKNLGNKILMDALDFQVREDGVYCEQSSYYHRYTTDFYSNLMILRQLEGAEIEQKHWEKLEQLLEFLLFITQPNGETPLFGDDDGGRFYFLDERAAADFRPTLALGATLLGRGDLKFVAGEAGPELLWLLGVEGLREFDKLEAVEPKETAKAFETSGFFAARDSWDSKANYLLIDCGIHGFLNGGHAHADALSFVLSLDGEPVFVDSGTFNYTSDLEARRVFRSTSAHNCLTVNGQSSSVPGGPFSWNSTANAHMLEWSENGDSILFRGTHDGFKYFNIDYEREIQFEKGGLITLIDKIKAGNLNSYELNFILSPHFEAEIADNSVKVAHKDKGKQTLLNISTDLRA